MPDNETHSSDIGYELNKVRSELELRSRLLDLAMDWYQMTKSRADSGSS